MARIHAERQWGKLLGYEAFDLPDLFAYFAFNRRALLHVLQELNAQAMGTDHQAGRQAAQRIGLLRCPRLMRA